MWSLLSLFIQHKTIGIPDQRSVVGVKEHLVWKLWSRNNTVTSSLTAINGLFFIMNASHSCLVIGFGTAEAKDEQMAMGVCAGKTLAVGGEFAVENRSVTLALNLCRRSTRNRKSLATKK